MKLRRNSSNDQPDAAPVAAEAPATPPVTNDATAALAMQAADVQSARFHTARKGYHKGEVDDFLDRVEAAIEAKNARIAELESQTAAVATPAAQAAVPAVTVPAAAPVAAPAPAETYPAQQVAQPSAPQASPAFGVPDAFSAAVPEQAPAAEPAAPAAAQAAAADGDGSFAAGWYADPWSQATYRYYDGSDWTAQTR